MTPILLYSRSVCVVRPSSGAPMTPQKLAAPPVSFSGVFRGAARTLTHTEEHDMANTRGATHIHGPSATGTIKSGNVTPPTMAPSVGPGSGANSGRTKTVSPGAKAPSAGRGGNPTSGVATQVNAGAKKTVSPGAKAPLSGGPSAKGVGAATPYKRKKSRVLGTGGTKPA